MIKSYKFDKIILVIIMNYKFMSFNIQSCRNFMTRKFSVDQIANVIKLYNPDIVGLNEVRGEKFIPDADESWFDQLKELSLKNHVSKIVELTENSNEMHRRIMMQVYK